MIKYKKGDILDTTDDAIAHQANCFSTMGSGIAQTLKNKWPELLEADEEDCRDPLDRLGGYSFTTARYNHKLITLFNLYGQLRYGRDRRYTDYEAIRSALRQCQDHCVNYDIRTISMPKIGCGQAGGNWDVVKDIIALEMKFTEVTVWELPE